MRKLTIDFAKVEEVIEITEDMEIQGLFIGRNSDELKAHLTFLHTKPHLRSRIHIKAVLYDNSKFDLEGLLKIDKGAVGTDTYLKVDCLVVGENASARAVPSLEINEDEVKGGHGATIGYIDPEQIHYLRSKGLNQKESEELVIEAFVGG